jgi:hypothetical protein
LDALVFMIGLLLGIFGFAEIYPSISKLVWSGALDVQTLPELFDLPAWVLGLAVAGMALGLFWVSAVVEKKFSSVAPE